MGLQQNKDLRAMYKQDGSKITNDFTLIVSFGGDRGKNMNRQFINEKVQIGSLISCSII